MTNRCRRSLAAQEVICSFRCDQKRKGNRRSAAETERVDAVRRAVRNGTYPITPETIADRMLALKLYWNPKK